VTRRSSSRPPSSALGPDAFLNEFGAADSRGRALDASGALAVNSELLSWFLADDGECQHFILGYVRPVSSRVPMLADALLSVNRALSPVAASRIKALLTITTLDR
jgi:hypothetical protein